MAHSAVKQWATRSCPTRKLRRLRNKAMVIDTAKLQIKGLHNAYNAMAAGDPRGGRRSANRKSLYDFAPVEHRLEPWRKRAACCGSTTREDHQRRFRSTMRFQSMAPVV